MRGQVGKVPGHKGRCMSLPRSWWRRGLWRAGGISRNLGVVGRWGSRGCDWQARSREEPGLDSSTVTQLCSFGQGTFPLCASVCPPLIPGYLNPPPSTQPFLSSLLELGDSPVQRPAVAPASPYSEVQPSLVVERCGGTRVRCTCGRPAAFISLSPARVCYGAEKPAPQRCPRRAAQSWVSSPHCPAPSPARVALLSHENSGALNVGDCNYKENRRGKESKPQIPLQGLTSAQVTCPAARPLRILLRKRQRTPSPQTR